MQAANARVRLGHLMMFAHSKAFAIVAILALSVSACTRGESPTQVAEKFNQGLATGDFAAARANATPETGDLIDRLVSRNGPDVLKVEPGRKVRDEVIDGDSAAVSFENADGTIATVPLVKVDGAWKVDFTAVIDNAKAGTAR